MNVILRVVGGPRTGAEFIFDDAEILVVGRSSQVNFPVNEDRCFRVSIS